MKLEFLADGSPDCPLLRLYDFHHEEAANLHRILKSLGNGFRESVQLDEEHGFQAVSGCRLTLQVDKHNLGLVQTAPRIFHCALTNESWDWMAELVEPFCKPEGNGYQWLNEEGAISLLLSKTGHW
jgi:hypothetical protein